MNREARRLRAAADATVRVASRVGSSLGEYRADLERGIATEDVEADGHLLLVLDSFVQRFQQLYEHLIQRLYPALFRAEQLGERPPPTLDLLRWLEEQGLIADRRSWGLYGEARHRLVHEYPLDPVERAEALTLALDYSGKMLEDLNRAISHIERKGLLND